MPIIVANTASTLAAQTCVVSSENRWAWYGFQTLTASGSVTWYRTGSPTSGCELIAISLSPMSQVLYGPFSSPNGLFAASIGGGCALVQLKSGSGF